MEAPANWQPNPLPACGRYFWGLRSFDRGSISRFFEISSKFRNLRAVRGFHPLTAIDFGEIGALFHVFYVILG